MAGAIAQRVQADSSASATTLDAASITVTAGNMLWVIANCDDATSMTPSMNSGTATIGAFTSQGSIAEAGVLDTLQHWTASITGSGTCVIRITYGSSVAQRCLAVVEVSGVSAVDGTAEVTDTGSNPTDSATVNVTTQPATGMMCLCNYQGAGSGVGTGWTLNGAAFWTTTVGEGLIQTKAITATGNTSGNFANAGLDRTCSVMIVFTDSGGGGGGATRPRASLALLSAVSRSGFR